MLKNELARIKAKIAEMRKKNAYIQCYRKIPSGKIELKNKGGGAYAKVS
jgi:PHP family Zn ribbon phosphoesterase